MKMEGKGIRKKKEKELESHCRLLSDRPSPQGIGCAAQLTEGEHKYV